MASTNGVRVGLYVLLWLFSVVLLGLCATRLHYTIFLPPFDPLNNGQPFFDPIVVELAVTSILALFWSMYTIHIIHRSYDYGRFSSFFFELLGLFVFFVLFLVGAAIASTFWGDLFWCHSFWQCRVLTVLVAFAWMCWVLTFFLFFASLAFAIANSAFFRPFHAQYNPHSSYYAGERKRRWFGGW
ncbi:uncharacterized protein BXZ73DRAFT_90922 [Epithele typhae]|uniref:uncharacterized protein n=1 Tax=Epithele typhae TaxID=378194 RepID=UPI002008D336|nr:uncharacterized protein BXZ73DRAFT_90922 [Epithele typhae]KAH9926659.1 hypothetical protein BXZ73DRAFT_90922 [Epithele typhae]